MLNEVDEVWYECASGLCGQKFIESALDKIAWLREMRPDLDIAVDGGIDNLTAPKVVQAGANILVSASYIFNSTDREAKIKTLNP